MSSIVFDEQPGLAPGTVDEFGPPPGTPVQVWSRMPSAERERTLLDYAFEERGDCWVTRRENDDLTDRLVDAASRFDFARATSREISDGVFDELRSTCGRCGAALSKAANFCENCGKPRSSGLSMGVVGAFVFLVVMAVFAVLLGLGLFSSGGNSDESDAVVPDGEMDSQSTVDDDATADDDAEGISDDEADEAGGPLGGTWTMFWTNAKDAESPAFTIRFVGETTGTVEILEDHPEFDTSFTVSPSADGAGDVVTFAFTRVFDLDPEYYSSPTVEEPSFFIGTLVGDEIVDGLWTRQGWSCTPGGTPECVVTAPTDFPARLTRDGM